MCIFYVKPTPFIPENGLQLTSLPRFRQTDLYIHEFNPTFVSLNQISAIGYIQAKYHILVYHQDFQMVLLDYADYRPVLRRKQAGIA